jgi:hypothetical protein
VRGRRQNKWPGDSYDFLRRNCCHFCDELCSQLAPGNSKGAIPGWLNRKFCCSLSPTHVAVKSALPAFLFAPGLSQRSMLQGWPGVGRR